MRNLLLVAIVLLSTSAVAIALLYLLSLVRRARPSERTHMDPLPRGLRAVWPLVNVLQFYASETAPTGWLVKWRRRLQLAGLEFVLKAEEFMALRMLSLLLVAALGLWAAHLLQAQGTVRWLCAMGGALLGWLLPAVWVRDRRKKREKDILRTLPGYLDMITLCCQAGLSLTGALSHAVQKGPRGTLSEEFERVMREMRTGVSRMEALNAMAQRLDNRHIKSLVANLTQAESLGASMADTLAAISEQRRTERFQAAEKLAMEAPVKMIGPLVLFIFPVTFIVIFFPLAMEFFANIGP